MIFTAWIGLTRGQRSLYGILVVSSLATGTVIAALVIFAAKLFRDSPAGLQLRASSEDMLAARAMGVPIARLRHLAWTLSAVVVALGGVMHATYLGVIGPNSFSFNQTFLTMAMVILGGARSVSGVIVGTMILRRDGILGDLEFEDLIAARRRRRARGPKPLVPLHEGQS